MSNIATLECEIAQENFLRNGGVLGPALNAKKKSGEIPLGYEYHEYPKAIRIHKGEEKIERQTETIRGQIIPWTETVQIYEDFIVADEAEEERVLSGGKTSAQIEEERQALYRRCLAAGIKTDPSWSVVRLKRELGEKFDEAPKDDMATLKARLAELEEMDAMRARIAELEGRLAAPVTDEASEIRAELKALGVTVDKRWGLDRLREELARSAAE